MPQGMKMTCPPDWQDKSMLILSAKQAGASGVVPNMVVTRDRMPGDLPADPTARLPALVDRQVAEMREKLAGLVEVSRRYRSDGGAPTAELKVDWKSAQTELTQSLTFVDTGDGELMIATATTGRGEFADAEPTFREMLRSFRLD